MILLYQGATIVVDHYWTETYRRAARWVPVPVLLALESLIRCTCRTSQAPTIFHLTKRAWYEL